MKVSVTMSAISAGLAGFFVSEGHYGLATALGISAIAVLVAEVGYRLVEVIAALEALRRRSN